MTEQPINPEITSDDKLWALLAYVFSPLAPIIIMLMDEKKDRPFIKSHNAQALMLGLLNFVVTIFIGWTIIGACVPLLIWFVMVYWGFQAYNGKNVEVPFISEFVKSQGWA